MPLEANCVVGMGTIEFELRLHELVYPAMQRSAGITAHIRTTPVTLKRVPLNC